MQTWRRNVGADECDGTPTPQEATQASGHILSTELPMLYRCAYQFLGNKADGEDALQDALLSAYAHLDKAKRKITSVYVDDNDRVQPR